MTDNLASIALVTGANAGIGAAVARRLAEDGHRVIVAGRRLEAIETEANAIAAATGASIQPLLLDVEDPESVESLVERLPAPWRSIDVLVNNAGHDRGGRKKFHEADPADFRSVIETNLIGLVHVTHAVIQGMVERNAGHIINIGSVQGTITYPRAAVYTASKFGIHGFSECLRIDYVNTAIRVTEIMPGLVQTQFAENRWGDAERATSFYAEFKARLWPADVANAVVYALSQPPHVDVGQIVLQPGGRN